MPDGLTRLSDAGTRWLNPAATVVIAGLCTVQLASRPPAGAGLTIAVAAFTVLGCSALLVRRRYPLLTALTFSIAGFVPGVVLGTEWENAMPASLLLAFVILAYTVGAELDWVPSVVGLVALALANTLGDLSTSLVTMWVFTVPPWAAGRVMRSRDHLATEIEAQARELEHEQGAYAREAVRYERARIARDLHDIVAHNLSMIVVQAGAGRRALGTSPATAAESVAHIEGGAHQAELEIEALIELLSRDGSDSERRGLHGLDDLVRRAAASGLSVRYRVTGAHDTVPPELAQAAYHVTQEGITNALKHAPGAPITVTVDASRASLRIAVENGPAAGAGSGLEDAGGGHGISGLTDRLALTGGALRAGATTNGGWRLEAELPRSSSPVTGRGVWDN